MNLLTHEKKPDSRAVGTQLSSDPMRIFLTTHVELRIESGDVLDEVARAVVKHWRFTTPQARRTVAFWFALGERRRLKEQRGWSRQELDASPTRRYDPSGRRARARR